MILCNVELHKAIDDKRLIIEPEPLPPLQSRDQECPYGTHSVDLRLGSLIRIPHKASYNFDLSLPGFAAFLEKNSDKILIESHRPFLLDPHVFVLGITLERVALPINTANNPQTNTCLSAQD